MPANFKNILIIKPSALGDVVLALPALSALRRSFPAAQISWLIRPELSALVENHPYLTEVIPFDRKFLGQAWYNPRAILALISLIGRLRRRKFDAVFDLQGLFRTAALSWLSGCERRFGMADAREFAAIFYTDKVAQDKNSVHLVDLYLKMAAAAGAGDIRAEFVFGGSEKNADSANKLLKNHNIEPGNYVVFVPGSAHSDKRWPVERFGELADKISSEFALPIVGVGTKPEKTIVEQIKGKTNAAITNLAGATGLGELTALLKTARLVVSNDTGPGHIAAALGVPLVMIFSWSNPARIAPYGRSECMAASEPYGRGSEIKSTDPRHSVGTITVEQVYQKVCEQMNP